MKKFLFIFGLALTLCLQAHANNGHENDLTLTQGGTLVNVANQCNTTTPCNGQVYKHSGDCAGLTTASTGWTQLTTALPASTTTANSSTFIYNDTTTNSGEHNCYYVTVTYISGGAPSAASNFLSLITPTDTPAAGTLTGVAK